jgi:hypothetical protein
VGLHLRGKDAAVAAQFRAKLLIAFAVVAVVLCAALLALARLAQGRACTAVGAPA